MPSVTRQRTGSVGAPVALPVFVGAQRKLALAGRTSAAPLHPCERRDVKEHLPRQRVWTCNVCHRDWPCRAAREGLLAEYAQVPIALALYLASAFIEASA